MSWTAPMTAVANATFFAAEFNTHIRDNLLETEVAKANVPHSIIGVSSTANRIAESTVTEASTLFGVVTTATSYVELQGGPTARISLSGVSGVIIAITANMSAQLTGVGAFMSYQVKDHNGTIWQSPSDGQALKFAAPINGASSQYTKAVSYITSQIATNTATFDVTAFYKTGNASSIASFSNRRILIIPF